MSIEYKKGPLFKGPFFMRYSFNLASLRYPKLSLYQS